MNDLTGRLGPCERNTKYHTQLNRIHRLEICRTNGINDLMDNRLHGTHDCNVIGLYVNSFSTAVLVSLMIAHAPVSCSCISNSHARNYVSREDSGSTSPLAGPKWLVSATVLFIKISQTHPYQSVSRREERENEVDWKDYSMEPRATKFPYIIRCIVANGD